MCTIQDIAMESATDATASLLELYMNNAFIENSKKVVLEMEKIDEEFSTAYKAARRYLDSLKETLIETSEILTIDLANRINISNQS